MKKQIIRISVICIGMLAAGLCYSCGRKLPSPAEKPAPYLETAEMAETAAEISDSLASTQETEARYYVHVCGEVNRPGVYELEAGSRIFQAVDTAGGFTEEAAGAYLNMAETVQDGMKIYVPSEEEVKDGDAASALGLLGQETSGQTAKVNINTADQARLMTLKGIGEARADDIIRYREEHGPFRAIEEIMEVSGIKDAAFQKIKEDITV